MLESLALTDGNTRCYQRIGFIRNQIEVAQEAVRTGLQPPAERQRRTGYVEPVQPNAAGPSAVSTTPVTENTSPVTRRSATRTGASSPVEVASRFAPPSAPVARVLHANSSRKTRY